MTRTVYADTLPRRATGRNYLRALDKLPAADPWCLEHPYCRRWEHHRGRVGRPFEKTYWRRSIRRQLSRQIAGEVMEALS